MVGLRFVATVVDFLVTAAAIMVGLLCLITGDGPWWLLPFGLIYLTSFGAVGRALRRALHR